MGLHQHPNNRAATFIADAFGDHLELLESRQQRHQV
jgi:hypothetical protein